MQPLKNSPLHLATIAGSLLKFPAPQSQLLPNGVFYPIFANHFICPNRREHYKGKPEHHEYELYLQIEGIEHSKTQVCHTQTNGICERLHRTMQEEFYAVAFRKKLLTAWKKYRRTSMNG